MILKSKQFSRTGIMHCRATIEEVFPLLCPRRKKDWIPGWEYETIWSKCGYNEEGAIFRTTRPYGTELFWNTIQYDINKKIVDFLNVAPYLFMFRFKIKIDEVNEGLLALTFTQDFTSVSEKGNSFIKRYEGEDFKGRLKSLEEFLNRHITEKRKKGAEN